MMREPAVSIVIPTLNEGKNIRACLRSVKAQRGYAGKVQVIVADGYSKDNTVALAKKEGAQVVFERKHVIAAGRQTGTRIAKGELIVFLDADGVAGKDWLYNLLAPFGDPRVVSTHGNLFMSGGNEFDNFFCSVIFPAYFRVLNFLGFPSGTGSNLAVRASAFRKVGGFDTDLVTCEDVVLQKKLRAVGKTVFVSSAVVSVSKRRVLKWGYFGYAGFHIVNWLRFALGMAPRSVYSPVRD